MSTDEPTEEEELASARAEFRGLPAYIFNTLYRDEWPMTKNRLRWMIREGVLMAGCSIGYGKRSHALLCRFLGLELQSAVEVKPQAFELFAVVRPDGSVDRESLSTRHQSAASCLPSVAGGPKLGYRVQRVRVTMEGPSIARSKGSPCK